MSGRVARVVAQAKINVGLRVLAREADGHHAIETIFARLALGDAVLVRASERERRLDCRGAETGPVERNLAWRAALAYEQSTGWPPGFAIDIEKRIPIGAGLGGGSADAGAVLRALDALAPHPVGEAELLRIATPLGADVPFLASTAALALAWGRGERLLRLAALPARPVALVVPDFAVSTADAYGWIDAARSAYAPCGRLLDAARLDSWSTLAPLADNDFEPVVAARHPVITTIAQELRRAGAAIAHLTGSGSAVYGVFDTEPDVAALALAVPGTVVLTRTASSAAVVEILGAARDDGAGVTG